MSRSLSRKSQNLCNIFLHRPWACSVEAWGFLISNIKLSLPSRYTDLYVLFYSLVCFSLFFHFIIIILSISNCNLDQKDAFYVLEKHNPYFVIDVFTSWFSYTYRPYSGNDTVDFIKKQIVWY